MNPHRIVILGAGFSKFAGLPLANELLPLVLADVMSRGVAWHHLSRDLDAYCEYYEARFGAVIPHEEVNLEDFVSFLDLEHFLRLRGSKTWSEQGNKGQLILRGAIARVLSTAQNAMTEEQWAVYEAFVKRLSPDDTVLTFNYDTILETACDRAKVPYRLCPHRYKDLNPNGGGTLIHDPGEVVICKVHGSIDWFDDRLYRQLREIRDSQGLEPRPISKIFDNPEQYGLVQLFEEPYPADDPLRGIWRAKNILDLPPAEWDGISAPMILTPSTAKLLYASRLREYWDGFNGMGRCNAQCVIVGFSFPDHDEYVMQPLVTAIRNFQRCNEAWHWFEPSALKVVDWQPGSCDAFCNRLKFIDWEVTHGYWSGFGMDVIDRVLEEPKAK